MTIDRLIGTIQLIKSNSLDLSESEPGPSIFCKTLCAPSEDSDQPPHSRCLISLRRALCEAKEPVRPHAVSED